MASLIRLDRRPGAWQHCFNVNGIAPSVEDERLSEYCRECGGPVCNFIIYREADGRRWATVQFFCDADAQKFRQNCDGRVVDGRRIEVKPLSRALIDHASATQAADDHVDIPASKVVEIINHHVGFNNWTSQIVEHPQPVAPPRTEKDAAAAAAASAQQPGKTPQAAASTVYRARVRVVVGGVQSIGLGESSAEGGGSAFYTNSAASAMAAIAQAKKGAITNAVKRALGMLVLIRLSSGKVVVRSLAEASTPAAPGQQAHAASKSRQPDVAQPRAEAAGGAAAAAALPLALVD